MSGQEDTLPSEEQANPESHFPTVGRWLVTALPRGWIYVANFGIRQMLAGPQPVPANISLGQDQIAAEDEFAAYVATQSRLIHHHLLNPVIAGPQATTFAGTEEALLFFVRHTSQTGLSMLHAQTYVRSGLWIGIVTLTTHEPQLKIVRPDYEAFLKGLRLTTP